MNKVILLGRLTKDVEMVSFQSGTSLAKFSLAVDRRYKKDGEPEADFFICNAWGKLGTFCENYLHKGTKIVVEGHLQNDSYTKDGKTVTTTKVICDSIEFAESKKTEGNNSDSFSGVSSDEELPFA